MIQSQLNLSLALFPNHDAHLRQPLFFTKIHFHNFISLSFNINREKIWYIIRKRREGGPTARSKKFKTPFFKDIEKSFQEVILMGPEPHHFFLFEISQQIWLLEASKVSAKMGRGWQADWAMAKIFLSNLRKHVINKCWKFHADISIHFWFRAKWLKKLLQPMNSSCTLLMILCN